VSVVVFPAPFAPTMLTISSFSTWNDTSLSAWKSPYRAASDATSSSAALRRFSVKKIVVYPANVADGKPIVPLPPWTGRYGRAASAPISRGPNGVDGW
jgi:hypothetical protein